VRPLRVSAPSLLHSLPMIPLVLAAVLSLPQQVPQGPALSPAVRDSAVTESRQAIMDVGKGVADFRTAHDALRRAVFNSSDAVIVQQMQAMRRSCQDLTAVARAAPPRLCRHCFGGGAQAAVNAYRAVLPTVAQLGMRCSTRMDRDLRAKEPAATLRRGIWAFTRDEVDGLAPYEARLLGVRRAFNLVSAQERQAPR